MELEELRAYGQDGKKTRTTGSRKTFVQRNFDWIAGTSTGAVNNKFFKLINKIKLITKIDEYTPQFIAVYNNSSKDLNQI
jgi:hypothetical protein